MPEGGAHLARCRRSGQELGLLPSRIFEGLRVKALGKWLGDRVPSHIEVAEAQLTTGGVACEEVAGTALETEVIIPRSHTVIESGDHVVFFLPNKRLVRNVENLFRVSATFF